MQLQQSNAQQDPFAVTQGWQAQQRAHLFTTWSAQQHAAPLEIVDARGARFQTAEGRWFWDLESQVYNVNAGHRHPHIIERMKAQLDTLPAAGPNVLLPVRARLAEELAKITGMAKAFLTTGGSEAVENAVKIARLVTGGSRVLARQNSYHGATLAVLEFSGDPRREPFFVGQPAPTVIADPFPCPPPQEGASESAWLASARAILDAAAPGTFAAVILEGFTGTNGMQVPPADFWPGVRELCDRHGVLLICDEIFAGFGRTGRWFARDHWGVRADLMTIGKGLTSGYAPLAGVMVSDSIAHFFDEQTLWCGLTHYAHPVSCAAAIGSIEVLRDEGLVENSDRVGALLGQGLERLVEELPHAVSTRGLGMMRALELSGPVKDFQAKFHQHGLYVPSRGNTAFICPPLCLTADEAHEVVATLRTALSA